MADSAARQPAHLTAGLTTTASVPPKAELAPARTCGCYRVLGHQCRWARSGWSLRSLPTQAILWFDEGGTAQAKRGGGPMSEKSKGTIKVRGGFKLTKRVELEERPKKENVIRKANKQNQMKQGKNGYSVVAGLGTYTDGHKRTRATALKESEAATQDLSSVQRMPEGKAP